MHMSLKSDVVKIIINCSPPGGISAEGRETLPVILLMSPYPQFLGQCCNRAGHVCCVCFIKTDVVK